MKWEEYGCADSGIRSQIIKPSLCLGQYQVYGTRACVSLLEAGNGWTCLAQKWVLVLA